MSRRISLPLRAVKIESFSAASAAALASAITAWIAANAGQRTLLDLSFETTATGSPPVASFVAFLTYTE